MRVVIKIALRNILKNKRRNILLLLIIGLSSMVLFITSSLMNGVYEQALRGYVNLQSGHVAVEWESTRDKGSKSAGKFLIDSTLDKNKMDENKEAIHILNKFIEKHKNEIQYTFYEIRRNGTLTYYDEKGNSGANSIILYSVNEENVKYLFDTKTLSMREGVMPKKGEYTIAISADNSDKYNIHVGDTVKIEISTYKDTMETRKMVVSGIYNNGAGYDNLYGFISEDCAHEFMMYPDEIFDVCRIYLENMNDDEKIANKLNQKLQSRSDVLLAETYDKASTFYTSISTNLKFFFVIFDVVLLILIAIGMQSTLKLNLYQRMKEFGTLRAIGYSKWKCFSIVFFEVFVMGFMAWFIALLLSACIIIVINIKGIYVGSGAISYTLGGEYVHGIMKTRDIAFYFLIIMSFSYISVFIPAYKICYQTITDTLAKRAVKMFIPANMIRGIKRAIKIKMNRCK